MCLPGQEAYMPVVCPSLCTMRNTTETELSSQGEKKAHIKEELPWKQTFTCYLPHKPGSGGGAQGKREDEMDTAWLAIS